MLWFKQCQRCEGDLYLDRDMYGPFVACLQCGYYLTDTQVKTILATGRLEPERKEGQMKEAVLVA
ncbi:MAG: hypothetical protein HY680_06915 [Chloroflexi bacterium]|nr:hypothetical protein [Chloroflexota bacterium]